MRNPTDLMQAILTDKTAQQIIDYVSPIYGNSYVGLWIFQAIGTVMGQVYDLAEGLKAESNPMTSTLLLDYWETHYGLAKDPALTTEQRQSRLASKVRSRGACNPAKLAAAVSEALGGAEVEIAENVDQNTFQVIIRDNVTDTAPAIPVIEQMKPAHLLYQVIVSPKSNPTTEITAAVAMTYAEMVTILAED